MSIINDALKKASRESSAGRKTLGLKEPLSTRLTEPVYLKKQSSFNWGPVFVLTVLCLITGPILLPLLSSPVRTEGLPSRAAEPMSDRFVEGLRTLPAQTSRKAQFSVEQAPLPSVPFRSFSVRDPLPPDLVLNGIVYSAGGDSFCLINDQVTKVGDTIAGATLTEVSANEVVLERNGQRIVLGSEGA